MKCGAVANDRTMWYDEECTIGYIIEDMKLKGTSMNMARTFRLYGLKFNDEKSFTSKYRTEFNLKAGKSMTDITLKEMEIFKNNLIGFPVKGVNV